MDRKISRKGEQEILKSKQLIEHTNPFKDVWSFKVEPARWVYDPNKNK